MSIIDRLKIFGFRTASCIKGFFSGLLSFLNIFETTKSFTPQQLSMEMPELRTADPVMASEFFSGHYSFAGQTVETHGVSPFAIPAPSPVWYKRLHSFEWLRHLSANKDKRSHVQAQTLLKDWIERYPKPSNMKMWDPDITATRLISWLRNSVVILTDIDHELYHTFLRALGTHVRFLNQKSKTQTIGMTRLKVLFALAYAQMCFTGQIDNEGKIQRKLLRDLHRQILPDGGHISRNPATIVEILALLLPLIQGYKKHEIIPPEQMNKTIVRLFQMLRFIQMGDGKLAFFNGAGYIERDLISAILRHDENLTPPPPSADNSGYHRLEMSDTSCLVDVGNTPPRRVSNHADAGCLSFTLSTGLESLIINCGVAKEEYQTPPPVWRSSDYHSTATLNGVSPIKYDTQHIHNATLNGQVFSSNLRVEIEREETEQSLSLTAAHYGYARPFKIRHQRHLLLENDGKSLKGNDWFSTPNKGGIEDKKKDKAVIRFHLAPDVNAALVEDKHSCLLTTRSGQKWQFTCSDHEISIEDSTFFAGLTGKIPIKQIVIRASVSITPDIKWQFEKL